MDFSKKIAEALSIKLNVVEEYFDVDEDKQGFFYAKLKPKKFLDKFQFRILCDLARKYGGEGYIEGAKAWKVPSPMAKVSGGSFTPKPIPPSIPMSIPQTSPTEDVNEEYSLKSSIAKVGPLYPVLVDSFGHVIDGFHRLEVDPNWPKFKVDRISGPVELAIARLAANVFRRDIPAEEKTEALRQIAQMTNWTPKQIAENSGFKYRWVAKYLPDEFKDQEMRDLRLGSSDAQRASTEKETPLPTPKPQDMSEGQIREFLDNPKVKEIVVAMNPSEFIPNADESSGESIPKPTDNSEPAHLHPNRLEGIQVHEFHCSECDQTFFIDHISPKIHKLHAVREVS